MGNYMPSYFKKESLKRKRKLDNSEENGNQHSPKRVRSTMDYLYQKLFKEGEGSDISITAFNTTWKLHKVYLCQSNFFSVMFSGSWCEQNQNNIDLSFTDENINKDSLDIVFGSFYNDIVGIDESNVVSILATSIWFQLNDLVNISLNLIYDNLRLDNIVKFYELSKVYALENLKRKCVEWLYKTLLLIDDSDLFYGTLQSITTSLMIDILGNPKLHVIQIEEDVLLLLLKWLYLKKFDAPKIYGNAFVATVQKYFTSTDADVTDVDNQENIEELFNQIRWSSIIGGLSTSLSILKFKGLPSKIICETFKRQWLIMLDCFDLPNSNGNSFTGHSDSLSSSSSSSSSSSASSNVIIGPPKSLDESLFWRYSERCGRILLKDTNATWRWSGFKYGVDVVIKYVHRLREFFVVRFNSSNDYSDWLSNIGLWTGASGHSSASSPGGIFGSGLAGRQDLSKLRRIQLQMSVSSFEYQSQTTERLQLTSSSSCSDQNIQSSISYHYPMYLQSTATQILQLTLANNEPIKVLALTDHIQFPIVVSMNLLRYDPTKFQEINTT